MKKLIIAATAVAFLLTGCGQPQKLAVDGKVTEYPTYGLLNQSTEKSEKVCYELSVGNVIWSVLLVETIVAPIYFVGFSLYNPISVKTEAGCGIDQR